MKLFTGCSCGYVDVDVVVAMWMCACCDVFTRCSCGYVDVCLL